MARHGAAEPATPARGDGGRSSGGHHGSHGGGGSSAATGSITAGADDSIAMGEFASAREHLEIRTSGDDVALGADAKDVVRYDTTVGWIRNEDGREIRAQWKNGALVIESRWNTGTKVKTTYSVLLEREQLEAVSHIELSSGVAVTARRVYSAAEP